MRCLVEFGKTYIVDEFETVYTKKGESVIETAYDEGEVFNTRKIYIDAIGTEKALVRIDGDVEGLTHIEYSPTQEERGSLALLKAAEKEFFEKLVR